jgi:acetoin utilization deacetylase AcuC-like enzyme
MIGFIHHDLFLRHLEGYGHVECPARLEAIMRRIERSRLARSIAFVEAEPARPEWLARVHDRPYIDDILSLQIDDAVMLDWGDTVATPATPQAALHAAGAGVQACRAVLAGTWPAAFCAVRPPGHHAEPGRAMGFCIFNNIAIAAADLLAEGGIHRVAIIDWDIHHGNGTEKMFLEDDRVLYISLHQYPHYPGTGHAGMTGAGRGVGFTLNIPMGSGAADPDYLEAFATKVLPAIDDFQPEFILISAGFDGHRDDPLSSTLISSAVFGEMTRQLKEKADRYAQGRIVSLLEGGYNVEALAESVEYHLAALLGS